MPAALIVGLGLYALFRFGSATDLAVGNWSPSVASIRDLFLLSTLAYMFAGFESASTLGDEIENPRRNVPRALLSAVIEARYDLSRSELAAVFPEAGGLRPLSGLMA